MLPTKRRRCLVGVDDSAEGAVVFAAKGVSKAQLKRIVEASGQPVSAYRMYESVKREAAHLLRRDMLVGEYRRRGMGAF